MTNDRTSREYDLEERTAQFGEAIIQFAKRTPRNVVSRPLIRQLVRSGTSVGANYYEADNAISRRDFRHPISICMKEARESKYWLRMLVTSEPQLKPNARELWHEAKELHLIFCAIHRRTRTK